MAYAMLALVAIFSLLPAPQISIEGGDKVLHFFTYFILSSCFTVLVRFDKSLPFIVIGLCSYGVMIEFLQGLTVYRSMEVFDMLANSAGVVSGLLIRMTSIPVLFRQIESRYFLK